MRRPSGPSRRTGRFGAAERKRLFAVSYIAQEGNGRAAARAAGYTGTDHALDVTASRLLRDAEVRAIIRGKVNAVEDGMGAAEIITRLTAMARLTDTPTNVFDFLTFLGPESAVVGQADGLEGAKAAIKGLPSAGFEVDLLKARRLGKGHLIREIGHDAETGAAKIKLIDNKDLTEMSRKALETLARIHGLLSEQPVPPPKPDLTMREVLRLIPLDVLRAYNQAVEEAMARAKAITTTAKQIGG